MHYMKLPDMDSPVSVFSVCQAHAQLESDYNVGGILQERPSNQRRRASTGVQLSRMKYRNIYGWVTICKDRSENDDPDDEDVRDIYLINVLKMDLPIDAEMRAFISKRYTPEFLEKFPAFTKLQ